jgi:hydrogenase maturation factor
VGNVSAKGRIKGAKISARVFRAETGKWKNLGTIASSKKSLIQKIKEIFKGGN